MTPEKKWRNRDCMLALSFCRYNWCPKHSMINTMAAVKAGFAKEQWSLEVADGIGAGERRECGLRRVMQYDDTCASSLVKGRRRRRFRDFFLSQGGAIMEILDEHGRKLQRPMPLWKKLSTKAKTAIVSIMAALALLATAAANMKSIIALLAPTSLVDQRSHQIKEGQKALMQPTEGAPLHLMLWRHDQQTLFEDALPIQTDDELHISCVLPTEYTVALYWYDTEANLNVLPMSKAESTTGGVTRWVWPSSEHSRDISGPAGTELVFLCARRDRAVDSSQVEAIFDDQTQWPLTPEHLWIEFNERGVVYKGERGPGSRTTDRSSDLLLARTRELRRELLYHCDVLRGIAFPHR